VSDIIEELDLSGYGCPLHYIKAREAVSKLDLEQQLILLVNKGDAEEEVLRSLQFDGQYCEVSDTDVLTAQIIVTRKK
jgi:TusA-related sulfurtransferase